MDKDRTRQLMRPRYRDVGKGEKIRHKIAYGELTTSLKERIAQTDPTERELLEWIIIQAKINNLHRMSLSDANITEDDINWPLTK